MSTNVVVPWITRLLLENDRVRIYEFNEKPGERTEMHAHPDFIVYPLTDGLLRFTFEDGESQEVQLKAGQPSFRNAHAHVVENVGNSELRGIVIDLKK